MAFEPTIPAYSGDGVAIWVAIDKNGNKYLKVKVLKGKIINCFDTTKRKQKNEKSQ